MRRFMHAGSSSERTAAASSSSDRRAAGGSRGRETPPRAPWPAPVSRSLLALFALLVFGVGEAAPAAAQAPRGRGAAELQLFGGYFSPGDPNFEPQEETEAFGAGFMTGARLGYAFSFPLFVQGELAYSPISARMADGDHDINVLLYGLLLGANLQASPSFQLFLSGGVEGIRSDPGDDLETEVDVAYAFGGGFRAFLTRTLALRVDLLNHFAPDGLSATRRRLSPDLDLEASRDAVNALELSGGVSFFFGGGAGADLDGDGVGDADDACPGTPAGVSVDATGCAADEDDDGVPRARDRCPDTPAGVQVSRDGCPFDSDDDGVPEGMDRCPDTPAGAEVDERGCAADTDGDGVPDARDLCPDTAAGAAVDDGGCATDGDGDGVPDEDDACPDTPADVRVGADGCPSDPLERRLMEDGRLVLEAVDFGSGSATLLPGSEAVLDSVAAVLARHPELRLEIQGHTDAVGPAAFNQSLSAQRAQAVLESLLSLHPDLDRGRFEVRGYGEERPVASNTTAEGRERNRRVEIVVLEDS